MSHSEQEVELEIYFEPEFESTSEEVPISEWSSLAIEEPENNEKKLLYAQGLFDKGSGEICTKYIGLSDSDVFTHPHYQYPSVVNPGIEVALHGPIPKKQFDSDGKDLYLEICDQLNLCPCRKFVQNLIHTTIDLSYYGVNPEGIKAMSNALKHNHMVEVFILTDNFLNIDACYHLGEMLMTNNYLVELNLSGCKIRKEGVERIIRGLRKNKTLRKLNLNRNALTDEGGEVVANTFAERGFPVLELKVSYNDLSKLTTEALILSFETYNHLTAIDLSWNKLYTGPTASLLNTLNQNQRLQMLDLSWNSLGGDTITKAVSLLLVKCQNLTHLNLSNNKFNILNTITKGIVLAKKIHTVNLSSNPISSTGALNMLKKICIASSKRLSIKYIFLDNVLVNNKFVSLYATLRSSRDIEITFEAMLFDETPLKPTNIKIIILKRLNALGKKKKKIVDVVLFVYGLIRDEVININAKHFKKELFKQGVLVDDDLMDELQRQFPGPKTAKESFINLLALADYMKRLWPEKVLPPPPDPNEVKPEKDKKRKKGKSKKVE